MRVEVAIGTLFDTPGKMNVKREWNGETHFLSRILTTPSICVQCNGLLYFVESVCYVNLG